jgi:hypothetical protein
MYPVAKGGQVAEMLNSEFRSGYSWQNFISLCPTNDMHKYSLQSGPGCGEVKFRIQILTQLAKFYRFLLHKRYAEVSCCK